MSKEKSPDWYDESKLRRVYFDEGYTGWVVDLGDGTCRLANNPLLGDDGPRWGDRVKLIEGRSGLDSIGEIVERYVHDEETS